MVIETVLYAQGKPRILLEALAETGKDQPIELNEAIRKAYERRDAYPILFMEDAHSVLLSEFIIAHDINCMVPFFNPVSEKALETFMKMTGASGDGRIEAVARYAAACALGKKHESTINVFIDRTIQRALNTAEYDALVRMAGHRRHAFNTARDWALLNQWLLKKAGEHIARELRNHEELGLAICYERNSPAIDYAIEYLDTPAAANGHQLSDDRIV